MRRWSFAAVTNLFAYALAGITISQASRQMPDGAALLNHPQYAGGYLNDVLPIGFTGADVHQFLQPQTVLFNRPSQVFSSNPRGLVLAMKLIF